MLRLLCYREGNSVWEKTYLILFVLYSKIIQSSFHSILTGEAGITQKASFCLPVLDATVIVHLKFFCNYEWDDIVLKTLLEHNQASHTAVSILKGVNRFKANMKIQNIIKSNFRFRIIFFKQSLDCTCNFCRFCCFASANLETTEKVSVFLLKKLNKLEFCYT